MLEALGTLKGAQMVLLVNMKPLLINAPARDIIELEDFTVQKEISLGLLCLSNSQANSS